MCFISSGLVGLALRGQRLIMSPDTTSHWRISTVLAIDRFALRLGLRYMASPSDCRRRGKPERVVRIGSEILRIQRAGNAQSPLDDGARTLAISPSRNIIVSSLLAG